MKRSTLIAALSAAAIVLTGMPHAAAAQDVALWRPTTAAGGAPVDPSFWNNQAAVSFNGAGGSVANVTIAPTTNTVYDYSTPVTNVSGGQTNVTAVGNLTNGGTFTVNTQRGDTNFDGNAQQNTTTTNASTTATLGDGSTVTTNTSSTNNGPGGAD